MMQRSAITLLIGLYKHNELLKRASGAVLILIITGLLVGCRRGPYRITGSYEAFPVPAAPSYADQASWAALPDRHDMADSIPKGASVSDGQKNAVADVFFVHPTIYTGKPQGPSAWNADVADAVMNQSVDQSTILNQASVFNGSCRVFAPRYRQAHYYSFLTTNKADKEKALGLAYADVKAAFLYYLEHYNRDVVSGKPRPIVIAAHSQGTVHATRLLAELFDGKPLQQQLVAAYLVGIATPADVFKTIPAGETPGQTGCFVSWNTFSRNYIPTYYNDGLNRALCTNPLTWSSSEQYAGYELNKGGVGPTFNLLISPSDAQVHKGLLWIGRLHVRGAALLRTKIWHRADYNLFWMNIRENVAKRVQSFASPAGK